MYILNPFPFIHFWPEPLRRRFFSEPVPPQGLLFFIYFFGGGNKTNQTYWKWLTFLFPLLCLWGVRARRSSSDSRTQTASVWSFLPTWSRPSPLSPTWPSSWRSRTRTIQWGRKRNITHSAAVLVIYCTDSHVPECWCVEYLSVCVCVFRFFFRGYQIILFFLCIHSCVCVFVSTCLFVCVCSFALADFVVLELPKWLVFFHPDDRRLAVHRSGGGPALPVVVCHHHHPGNPGHVPRCQLQLQPRRPFSMTG